MKNAHRDKLNQLILNVIKEIGDEEEILPLINADFETTLYGAEGSLTSLQLVRMIAEIEEKVSEEFGKDVVIADERAMSQRNSPFRNAGVLADYIDNLLNEYAENE